MPKLNQEQTSGNKFKNTIKELYSKNTKLEK